MPPAAEPPEDFATFPRKRCYSRLPPAPSTRAAGVTLLPAPGETALRAMLAVLVDKDSGRVADNWRASLANSVA